jgi:RNA polymerase sigma factor (sigma-70 family)
MEVSALRYSGGVRLHGASPLLRLQSDERLIALLRRGNTSAFEVLVSRYHSRLLAFCRHLLGSKEDAEDVLQEVLAAAFNAILADERPINVRPWLYRIARNRSLNHLRRIQAIGVDSMDIHFAEYGATTADKVHDREQFRLLVRDIQTLPETQRTALVLREMDALSYDQIAEAMETTVPGVKSLLVRARISLAEAAEARQLSCDEVRIELAEVAEGLHKRPAAIVRRHIRACNRCASFQSQLKQTNKVLAALLPIGPLAVLRKLLILHLGHSAGSSGATATATASATSATVASTAGGAASFGSAGGLLSAGALATKAAAGLAAAAIVTAGAVEVTHVTPQTHRPPVVPAAAPPSGGASVASARAPQTPVADALRADVTAKPKAKPVKTVAAAKPAAITTTAATTAQHPSTDTTATQTKPTSTQPQTQTDPTVLSGGATSSGGNGQATDPSSGSTSSSSTTSSSSGSSCSSSTQSTNSSGTTTTTTSTTPSSTTTTPQTTTDPSSAPPTSQTSTAGTTTTPSCPSPTPSTPGP